jgi:maltokinase
MIDPNALAALLARHLPQQRWFAGRDRVGVEVERVEPLCAEPVRLLRALVRVPGQSGIYQIVAALRAPGFSAPFLEARPQAVIGEVATQAGERVLVYDALVDPQAATALLARVAPEERATRARVIAGEQSNSSVVFDDRLILKLFRHVSDGPNPDAEVVRALQGVGFECIARLVADWHEQGRDYAVVNEFLAGAVDGFELALQSVRELCARSTDAATSANAFAREARLLGETTARMHVKLAAAFGTVRGEGNAWAADMEAQLARVQEVPGDRIRAAYRRVAAAEDPGPAIRVHGDYHLGQAMWRDPRWFVLDFEGEPARPLAERRRPTSPLKDVAGMLRSFDYAAAVALCEPGEPAPHGVDARASRWREHTTRAFLDGYFATPGVDAVLPASSRMRSAILDAFLLDKAVYEVAYEQAHRPDWVGIPQRAIARLLG